MECDANLRSVLDAAGDRCFVHIDMKRSAWINPTLDLFEQVWKEGYHNVGVALQSYLYRTEHGLTAEAFEFEMFFGIRRDLQNSLLEQGYHVRTYLPFE